MNLTPEQREKLKAAAEAIPVGQLHPYATVKGGVVILNGPFPIAQAQAIVRYVDAANPAVILALLAQLDEAEARHEQG